MAPNPRNTQVLRVVMKSRRAKALPMKTETDIHVEENEHKDSSKDCCIGREFQFAIQEFSSV
jgi:hypothetical protein